MLTWWIVGTWGATAVGGVAMAAVFLRHNGMAQSEREAIGPLRVLPHVGFAVAGFALWVAYAAGGSDTLGWVAMAGIAAAFLIAGTFMLTREQHRRADLARLTTPPLAGGAASAPAAAPVARERRAVPAEHFIPIWLASGHGLLGGATLVLVLLERAGVGGS
ncbi:MAG TPA: hypothetical protein VFT42_09390 [Solirubrobacteraceae bacterium]|nr:hypothetical protein [Solirubrobacteraceae bacterium]